MKPRRPKFRKSVLENGLTLLTEQQSQFRSLSIGVWVKTGTRHETAREAGMSHFLEHMLFKGTSTRSALDIARAVDRVGGEFNAFTTREYTCFHILLLDRDVNLGIDILSDVILNSDFESTELERERKVILQEIAMVDEAPEELAHDIFWERIYGRHGLGRTILGSARAIRKLKRADLLKFFRKHYRPDQMIVSVSGDVSHEAVRKRINGSAGLARQKWPGRKTRRVGPPSWGSDPAPPLKTGRWWVPRPTEQVHLLWGVEGPAYGARDRMAAFLMNVYLGGGMSSSLFQEIREKNGLAYTVYSSLTPFTDSGVFTIYAATGPNQVPLCLRLIEECVQKMRDHLMTTDELMTIKQNLKGTVLLSADGVEPRMSSIASNEIFLGRYYSPDDVCKLIDAVGPEDIRRLARRILRPERASVLALGPRPSPAVRKRIAPIEFRDY